MNLVRLPLIFLLAFCTSITMFGCLSSKEVSLGSLQSVSEPYRTWSFPVFRETRKIGKWRSSIPIQWRGRANGGIGNGKISVSMLIQIQASHRKSVFSKELSEYGFGREALFAPKQYKGFRMIGARSLLRPSDYNLHAYNPTSGLHVVFLIESASTPWKDASVLQLLKAVLDGKLTDEND